MATDPREALARIARGLRGMPGVYTIGPGNELRVIELLWEDARKAADAIDAVAAGLTPQAEGTVRYGPRGAD